MNALANDEVGNYLNDHFFASFLKVGTFTVAGNAKQGGNVASYFCLPDGSVLNAIAGPVDAATMLREARFAVETNKLATFEAKGNDYKFREFFRKAHLERLEREDGVDRRRILRGQAPGVVVFPQRGPAVRTPPAEQFVRQMPFDEPSAYGRLMALNRNGNLNNQGQVHVVMSYYPLVKVQDVYKFIFERILNEKVSTLPVVQQ